jgi:hypothetical protein
MAIVAGNCLDGSMHVPIARHNNEHRGNLFEMRFGCCLNALGNEFGIYLFLLFCPGTPRKDTNPNVIRSNLLPEGINGWRD